MFCEDIYSAFATWFTFSFNKAKKNYKARFSTNLILKNIDKDNFGKKKTHEEKRCSNWKCFVRKTTLLFPIKLTKIILEKIIKKKPFREILYQSTVFCEENNNAFSIWFSFIVIIILNQLNIKKKLIKIILKKIIKKIMWENTAAIHSVLKKKITKLNSQSAHY